MPSNASIARCCLSQPKNKVVAKIKSSDFLLIFIINRFCCSTFLPNYSTVLSGIFFLVLGGKERLIFRKNVRPDPCQNLVSKEGSVTTFPYSYLLQRKFNKLIR